jgi:hypothetical protein
MNHVHLVVISEVVRHGSPGAGGETGLGFKCRFEAGNPRKEFGAHSDPTKEQSLKLAEAQSGDVGQMWNAHSAASQEDPVGGSRDAVEAGRLARLAHEQLVDDSHALIEGPRVADALLNSRNKAAQDRMSLIPSVCQLVRGNREQSVQAIRLEHDDKRFERATEVHFAEAICLWTYDHGGGGSPRYAVMAGDHMGQVSEFEYDHWRGARRDGMNHWGVAYPDFTLDVEANKLLETRGGGVKTGLKDGRLLSPFTFQNGREGRLSGYCAKFSTLMS